MDGMWLLIQRILKNSHYLDFRIYANSPGLSESLPNTKTRWKPIRFLSFCALEISLAIGYNTMHTPLRHTLGVHGFISLIVNKIQFSLDRQWRVFTPVTSEHDTFLEQKKVFR